MKFLAMLLAYLWGRHCLKGYSEEYERERMEKPQVKEWFYVLESEYQRAYKLLTGGRAG